jgi:dehydrogenase/reductase SDR family member 7B
LITFVPIVLMKDKVVIITGGSSGIGKALAFEFGLQGSKLLITGRRKELLLLAESELKAKGIVVNTFAGDVSVEEDNEKMVKRAIELYGRIDVLVNNAGISMRALFEELDLEVFKKVMEVNFFGTVYATKYALPYILKSKGSVVGISSVNGRRATPARSAYSASKYAMEGFLESLRTEVMKRDVHVLSVCPGFTSSNIRNAALTAHGTVQGESPRNESKMMKAEEAAAYIYQAIIDQKRDLVLTVQGKMAVWLNKVFPGWMDNLTYKAMRKEQDSPLRDLPG